MQRICIQFAGKKNISILITSSANDETFMRACVASLILTCYAQPETIDRYWGIKLKVTFLTNDNSNLLTPSQSSRYPKVAGAQTIVMVS